MPDPIQAVCTGSFIDYDNPVDETSKTTVRLGESNLSDIARSRSVDPQALLAENPNIASLYAPLLVGQEIHLPVCVAPVPADELSQPPAPAHSTAGDPLAKSVVQANLKKEPELPPDEANMKAAYGEEGLRLIREMKQEFFDARKMYQQTGKLPALKYHAPIEIITGKWMTRSQRYDLNLIHQGKPPDYPQYTDADPNYLTSEEFRKEWTGRGEKEIQDCIDDGGRQGTIERCKLGIKEKYMGKEYMDASFAAARARWNEGAYIESIKNSGPLALGGRVVGRSIGYLVDGDKGADKGEEIGALAGGVGDVAVAVKSGANARARLNAYEGTAGLEVRRDVPVEVARAAPPAADVKPDPPAPAKAPAEGPSEPLVVSHGTDNAGFQNMGGLGPGRIRVDQSPGAHQDFGQGFYLSVGADKGAIGNAEKFGDLRVQQRGSGPRQVMAWEVNRSELGDVVDVRPGGEYADAWKKYLDQPLAPNVKMTVGEYIRTTGVEHRGEYFEKFLSSIGKQNADAVIGPIGTPETAGVVKEPGTQLVIRSQRVADRLNAKMAAKPDPPTPTNKPAVPKEGSGTSVHAPKPTASTAPDPPFSEGELEVIGSYMRAGKSRTQAEAIVLDARKPENKITWVRPTSPNAAGTTRVPNWKKPGAGKKKP